jgi:hypothetical protein
MKIALITMSVAVSTVCLAEAPNDVRARAKECQSRHGSAVIAGATLPKSDPIRLNPTKFEPPSAFACVIVAIDESGRIVDARVVETDHAPFGEHLREQVLAVKWRPAILDGVPIAFTSVVSGSYGSSVGKP